jgi:hypothetical protein
MIGRTRAAFAAGFLLAASPAHAATLGTALLFQSGEVGISCRAINLGTRPVVIRRARILGNSPGAGVLGVDVCTGVSLGPEFSCSFAGTSPSGHIGAALEVKGSGKSLRVICSVSVDGTITERLEMR